MALTLVQFNPEIELTLDAQPIDPIEGVVIHDITAVPRHEFAAGVDGFRGKTK